MAHDVADRLGSQEVFSALVALSSMVVPANGGGSAGISLFVADRWERVAASDPLVSRIWTLHEELNEGPEDGLLRLADSMHSSDLRVDARWPRFGPAAAARGAHSLLALPIPAAHGRMLGALTVYGTETAAFDSERSIQLAERIAAVTGLVIGTVVAATGAKRDLTGVRSSMASRAVIDQAIGILRSRQAYSTDEALERLRTLSQRSNVRLAEVASAMVDDAVRRAQARRPG